VRSQVLTFADSFKAMITTAAWRSQPSWMLVAAADRTINPDLERWYGTRANSHKIEVSGANHAVYISRPKKGPSDKSHDPKCLRFCPSQPTVRKC
jgi:hypothetical protein